MLLHKVLKTKGVLLWKRNYHMQCDPIVTDKTWILQQQNERKNNRCLLKSQM